MAWSIRQRHVGLAALCLALTAACSFEEPAAFTGNPDACDNIGIVDLEVVPLNPSAGTEFEFQWTRVGGVGFNENLPDITWIAGNADVIATLEIAGGFTADVTEPFDYTGFQVGEGVYEEPAALSVAAITPNFVELEPGEYSASVEVVGNQFTPCPAPGTTTDLSITFEIGPATTCGFPDITRLDLEARDLTFTSGPPVIEWFVDYNVESAGAASPPFDVSLSHEVTVTDPATDSVLGATTVATPEPILPGESVSEMVPLSAILDQAPGGPITISVEVTSQSADAECGGSQEDLSSNNTIEITTE